MRSIKRIITTILFLTVLFVSVNAEGTYDLYFNASLDLATGETTYTPMELDENNDSSDLWVEVTKIAPDGTTSEYYSGRFGDYDNGRWINIDLSNNKPLLLYDWQTKNSYWVVPISKTDENGIKGIDEATVLSSTSTNENSEGYIFNNNDGSLYAEMRIAYNNEFYETVFLPNNTLNISIYVSNSGSSRNLICYLAEYDASGTMIDFALTDMLTIPAGENITANLTRTFSNTNTASVKVFLWDANDLTPITSNILLQSQYSDYYADVYTAAQSYDISKIINGKVNTVSDIDYVKFVPAETGKYVVHTKSTANVSGGLYDSQNNLIVSGSESNGGYYCDAELISGNTYYLKTSGNTVGEYDITITKMSDDGFVEIKNDSIRFTKGCNNSSQVNVCLTSTGIESQNVTVTPSDNKITAEFDVDNLQTSYNITVIENDTITAVYGIKTVSSSNVYDVTEKSYVSVPMTVSNVSDLSDIYFSVAFSENEFNVFDVCEHTYTASELGTGLISSAEVDIKAIEDNAVVFTSTKTFSDEWSGNVNVVKLQAVDAGEYTIKTIAYSVK